MRISHDVIATKTCPSYEFLVVFGQVWFEIEKCGAGASWDGLRGGAMRVNANCRNW